jgi:hypothetical protein
MAEKSRPLISLKEQKQREKTKNLQEEYLHKHAGKVAANSKAHCGGPIIAQCGRRRGPRHLGAVVHSRVHTTQLLGAGPGVPDLDDVRPIDLHRPLGHVQEVIAGEGFFEEGPSTTFPMGLHQCRLKRGDLPFGRRRPAPTVAIRRLVLTDRELVLYG